MNFKYVLGVGAFVSVFLFAGFLSNKDTPVKTTVVNVVADKVDSTAAQQPVAENKSDSTSESKQIENKAINKLELPASKVLRLQGEVGYNINAIIEELKEKEKTNKDLYLLIDSPGGSVLDGAMLISAMEASSANVHTVCMGICASMAFVIHQYGTTRLAVDRAILMAHPASMGLSGNVNQIRSRLNVLTRYVDKMEAHIAKRAGMSASEFKTLAESEFWIDAEDAMKKNLVDTLVDINTEKVKDKILPFAEEKSKVALPARTVTKPSFNIVW